eukprot:TRINITY_DN26129_c0_g1_i2.p1 TRINITY_DN26129_c0_g1~~TRINITY_DN26129_c0_g1_i2.p1  ORF type:complete len:385 (+),score=87.60 TRINITY_DN26129_c0_g1_i2:75-1229(+)
MRPRVALAAAAACVCAARGGAIDIFELPNRQPPVLEFSGDGNLSALDFLELAAEWGTPAIFRGLARDSPAFHRWQSDEQLTLRYGGETVSWEQEKTETRRYRPRSGTLSQYNDSEIYLVGGVPGAMQADVLLPPFLACGHQTRFLFQAGLWFSSGGTKGLIHSDAVDNLNCAYSGVKRAALWDPRNKSVIEWELSGWRGPEANLNGVPYGGSSMGLSGGQVDLRRTPVWAKLPWWKVEWGPGDCLFLPAGWYHHVRSPPGVRTISVNVGWHRDLPSVEARAALSVQRCRAAAPVPLADCRFGYQGWNKTVAVNTEPGAALTGCRGVPRVRGMARHAEAPITPWLVADAPEIRAVLGADLFNGRVRPRLLRSDGRWRVAMERQRQ